MQVSDKRFTVALTRDAVFPDGSSVFGDLGLERLTDHGVAWRVLPRHSDPIPTADLEGFQAVLSLGHASFGRAQVDALPELLLIARFGAGYETIDLDACTHAGVAVTNTPDAVRRPLALAALTMVLSLAHNLPSKDRIVRQGRWDVKSKLRGHGVDGKTLGIIGFGSVGAELAALAQPLGFDVLGNNRSGSSARATELGVPLLDLDTLLARSDYVVLTASLTEESRGMIDARRLSLMKHSAYFVNVARGAIVNQRDLTAALRTGVIAGAGLDVFEPEPLSPDDDLVGMENVILSPHSLPHTEEFTRDASRSAIMAILAIADGEVPQFLLNPEVLQSPAWAQKIRALTTT